MVKVQWDVGQGWGCRVGWFTGVLGKERGETQKTCFSAGYTWYILIISRTFAKGRYSLIASDM